MVNITSNKLNNSFIYCFPPIQSMKFERTFDNSIIISSSSSSIQLFNYGNNSFLVLSRPNAKEKPRKF